MLDKSTETDGFEFERERDRRREEKLIFRDGGKREIPLERVIDLLANRYRRDVIAVLIEQNEPIAVKEIAGQVADRYSRERSNNVSVSTQEQIATELHHQHLPKLDESGIIDYNPTTGEITTIRTADIPVRIGDVDRENMHSFEFVFRQAISTLSDIEESNE